MKYFKKILIVFTFIAMPFLSKANQECSCTLGSENFGKKLTWFTVGADSGCANPTPGLALDETMFQGSTIGSTYMSSQDAADLCALNNIYWFWNFIY